MRLKKLILRFFKGVKDFEFEPDGQSVIVYGANATGKTTIADAVSYLLFDKDTADKSPASFGIKTLDANGEPLHGQEHTVEATFSLEEGGSVTLRKIYKEKWTTRRGSHDSELTGHTTDYYWDDEPISQKEYKDRIDGIMPEQLFKMLTLPNYFAEIMHWKERRDILTEICGEITDQQIMDDHPELSGYSDLLDGKTQQARESILRERKKKLNKEIDSIPDRIDENDQKIVSPDQSAKGAEQAIEILQTNLEGKREKLSEAQSGGGVAELNVKLQKIEAEKAEYLNDHQAKVADSLKEAREKVAGLESKVDESTGELRAATREHNEAKEAVETAEKEVEQIASDIDSEQKRTPQPRPEKSDEPEVCALCEQPLPRRDEDHKDHYDQYLKEFNAKKADTLKKLKADFEQGQANVDRLYEALKEKEMAGAKIRSKDNQRKEALKKAKQALEVKKEQAPAASTESFDERQKVILEKIEQIKNDRQSRVNEIKEVIAGLEQQIEAHRKVLRQHEFNEQIRTRNAELREALKKYGNELNDVESGLNMIEDFNRAKAEHITGKVNDLFEIVNWRLFKDQVNGGIDDKVCDPVVDGVPFSEGLNTGSRVKAGVDIINTLSRFYGKSAPIWIDNRESVTELPDSESQIISLIVSPEDRQLRVERAEPEMVAA